MSHSQEPTHTATVCRPRDRVLCRRGWSQPRATTLDCHTTWPTLSWKTNLALAGEYSASLPPVDMRARFIQQTNTHAVRSPNEGTELRLSVVLTQSCSLLLE